MQTVRHWSEIGASAIELIDRTPQGRKEAELALEAEASGLRLPTLRTYIFAARFVGRLDSSDRAKALSLPVASVEVIARWHAHDPESALSILRNYDLQTDSVRKIREKERTAKSRARAEGGKLREDAYREFAIRSLHRFNREWPAGQSMYPIFESQRDLAAKSETDEGLADFVVWYDARKTVRIAGLIVGPYRSEYLYTGRAVEWCLRALALTYFYDAVALVLPQNAKPSPYLSFLKSVPGTVAAQKVEVLREPKSR
jgi:hypothetical protein